MYFPVMTERTRLISYLLNGIFSVILKINTITIPEVILHIRLGAKEVIRLALAMALFVVYTREVSACQFFFQSLKI